MNIDEYLFSLGLEPQTFNFMRDGNNTEKDTDNTNNKVIDTPHSTDSAGNETDLLKPDICYTCEYYDGKRGEYNEKCKQTGELIINGTHCDETPKKSKIATW